jgi:hypothetical protein
LLVLDSVSRAALSTSFTSANQCDERGVVMMRNLAQGVLYPLRAGRAIRVSMQFVKNLLWIPIAIVLLPSGACAQALPDAPAPAAQTQALANPSAAAMPDWKWRGIQQLSDGQPIVVRTTSGAVIHCRFAGATDTCLFCDPSGRLLDRPGYQFDRNSIVNVRESRPQSDVHPGLLVTAAVLGTVVGVVATQDTTSQGAAATGLLTSALVAGVGYQIIQFNKQVFGVTFALQPRGFGRGPGRFPRLRSRTPGGE